MSTDSKAWNGGVHDAHGQPIQQRLRKTALQQRNVDELIGICRGISIDGMVSQAELEPFYIWLHSRPTLIDVWPGNVLYARLKDAFEDDFIDKHEAQDILDLLLSVVGGEPDIQTSTDTSTGEIVAVHKSASLPITEPENIQTEGCYFVLTGRFAAGPRKEWEKLIIEGGGICQKSPTTRTDYVVIGTVGSRDWAHSTWGRKIEAAVELQKGGHKVEIISEEYWISRIGLKDANA
uniref:BRCT domain-containing protein n=1 Tax=Marinobacterium profundum TaxID=1714300 RepID=UPI00082D1A02|nr:BRCT domain-containing protein [Marinobacterium profundum]